MQEIEETPAPFEAAASEVMNSPPVEVTNRIAQATPKEVALICRKTFLGVEALLEPLVESLSDQASKSVEDSADSLAKIYSEYSKLKKKGGVENGILDEIKRIMPGLIQARSYIKSALDFLQDSDLKNDNYEYKRVLPVYQQHIMNAYNPILDITIFIRGLPEITPEDIAREKQNIVDTG